ncbi:MAG: DUF3472 domain-containing protein [Burkholderiales bacterium]|nr:DUF3472 domain-containing protein [Burkholderiales bacterium]
MPVWAQVSSAPHALSLTYINWAYPNIFNKIETDLKFINDPGIGTSWFLAHQFGFFNQSGNEQGGGYIGLQTNTIGTGGQKGVIFSIWDATYANPGSGATCQDFGGEGIGKQCFKPYPWVAGKTYRLKVVKDGGLSYSGFVVDMSTTPATETYIGQIQAPSFATGFHRRTSQWAEYYGPIVANCADYKYVKVLWTRPKADGGATTPTQSIYLGPNYCENTAVIANGMDSYMEAGNPGTSSQKNLTTSKGKYLYAVNTSQGCGGGGLKGDAFSSSICAQITRVALPNGKVALQTENGYYLSCVGGGSTVSATSRTVGNYETFTESVVSGVATYKSYGGKYLTVPSYGTPDLKCSAYFAGTTEKFKLIAK